MDDQPLHDGDLANKGQHVLSTSLPLWETESWVMRYMRDRDASCRRCKASVSNALHAAVLVFKTQPYLK